MSNDFCKTAMIASMWKEIALEAIKDLQKIADTDYRGNRSSEASMAFQSVQKLKIMTKAIK